MYVVRRVATNMTIMRSAIRCHNAAVVNLHALRTQDSLHYGFGQDTILSARGSTAPGLYNHQDSDIIHCAHLSETRKIGAVAHHSNPKARVLNMPYQRMRPAPPQELPDWC